MPRVLIVEDEPKIASLVADYLRDAEFETSIIADGADFDTGIERFRPDIIVLDVMLPHTDGLTLLKQLRQHSQIPVILLTARVEEIDRLLGLELGADDYICKPFSPREVVARIKSVLRRTGQSAVQESEPGKFSIDEMRMEARIDGTRLDLTPVEFRLLQTLMRFPGRVYRRDELLDSIYDDYREVSDRTIDSHIKNLRKKIRDVSPDADFVRSVYGIGYRFEAEE